jgi:hypothetical protein
MELQTEKGAIAILADADLILEFFANRGGYVEHVEALFETMQQSDELQVYITDHCLEKVRFYLSRQDDSLGDEAVTMLETLFEGRIISINQSFIERARHSPLKDFESAIEAVCAIERDLKAIVTHTPENFAGVALPIWQTDQWEEKFHQSLNQQLLMQMILQGLKARIPKLSGDPEALATRIAVEVEQICHKSKQIQESGKISMWKTAIAKDRLLRGCELK